MKKLNPSSTGLDGDDWVPKNLILLSHDPRESYFGLKSKLVVRK